MIKNNVLDLHHLKFRSSLGIQGEVEGVVDSFLHKMSRGNYKHVEIIVGKGINSKRLIEGKNPLRYYVETYLQKAGYGWRNGGWGEEGVIIVDL